MFYAQIDNNNNMVIGVSQLAEEISDQRLIRIDSYDESLIGKRWNGSAFIDPELTPNYLYIHLAMTGDGRTPVGIKNNGVDSLAVTATFRQTSNPASPAISSIHDVSWRVTIRDTNNNIYDIVDVNFIQGVAAFNYTTNNNANICQILESDFEVIEFGGQTYTLKLIGDSTFKVYRDLT